MHRLSTFDDNKCGQSAKVRHEDAPVFAYRTWSRPATGDCGQGRLDWESDASRPPLYIYHLRKVVVMKTQEEKKRSFLAMFVG